MQFREYQWETAIDWEECKAAAGHYNVVVSGGQSPGYFLIGTEEVKAYFYVTPGLTCT